MKLYDDDTQILLKVYADGIDPLYFRNTRHYLSESCSNTITCEQSEKLFALRFGAVAITLGSTVQRQKLCSRSTNLFLCESSRCRSFKQRITWYNVKHHASITKWRRTC